jgi:hypothetical protein
VSKIQATLDACVLYPAFLRDVLLVLAEAGFFAPIWSAEILDEVKRNLIKDSKLLSKK